MVLLDEIFLRLFPGAAGGGRAADSPPSLLSPSSPSCLFLVSSSYTFLAVLANA